jgi:glutathione synthase/RimK-type ligase-like ATP-grasp enzyme
MLDPHASVLVAGGDADPNLAALLGCLHAREIACEALLVGARSHPRVTWDLQSDVLRINGEERRPTAVFLRHDVFTSLAEQRPAPGFRAFAWFTAMSGWAHAHPDVRMLNRASALHMTNKLHVLKLAQEVGLEIPSTLVTNDFELLTQEAERQRFIVKPVNGGDYTRELKDVLEIAPHKGDCLPAPAIVQERLVPPEIRVYGIGGRFFAFRLVADALDYRSTTACKVLPMSEADLPSALLDGLGALMQRLKMDFGAADFKACPEAGRLRFLEINNGPMFAAFDAVCERRLTHAIADFLSMTS